MTKRTAMLMAAGVVAALFAGSLALAFGLSGNTAASADSPKTTDPIVRTVHRTVRVEKEAKPAERQVQVVTLSSDTSSVNTVSSDDAVEDGSGDDAFEDEADDQFEDESHESEDGTDSTESHDEGGFEDD
jgi:hypothetical protein